MYSSDEIIRTDEILIVDDTEPNRVLLEAIVKHAGFKAAVATNGLECLEYCAKKLPRLILLDIMMPELDGISALKSLREVYSKQELPIILVTTRSEGADLKEGFAAGASDYVVKPVDRLVLLARMQGCIQLADSHQSLMLATEQMEQALSVQKLIGDALPEVIVVHDEDGRIVYANNSLYEAIAGPDLSGSIRSINRLFEHIYGGAFHARYEERIKEHLYNPSWTELREVEIKGPPSRFFELFSEPINFNGHFLRIWVWRDITSYKELERRMNQQIRLDTVSLFASGVAHNFNNIMGGILGASELLKRSKEERSQKCQAIIQRAVEAGMRLTEKMGALSRRGFEEHGEERKQLKETILDISRRLSEQRGQTVTYLLEIPPDLHLEVSSRNTSVILENILSNALDSVKESGTIRVSVADTAPVGPEESGKSSGEQDFTTLIIEDDGAGMSDDELQRIFEPFYSTKNLDVANNLSVEGNGLGLWNVYNIVKMYEGDIQITSKKGAGTVVRLTLPKSIAHE